MRNDLIAVHVTPESRAAARAILASRTAPPSLTQDEADCVLLYGSAVYLTAQNSPDYHDLENTAAYQRGRELNERYGAALTSKRTKADYDAILEHPEAFRAYTQAEQMQPNIDAWQRQIPDLPCPWRIEDGKVYRRLRSSPGRIALGPLLTKDGADWEQVQ
jgi:hypothetical protein